MDKYLEGPIRFYTLLQKYKDQINTDVNQLGKDIFRFIEQANFSAIAYTLPQLKSISDKAYIRANRQLDCKINRLISTAK